MEEAGDEPLMAISGPGTCLWQLLSCTQLLQNPSNLCSPLLSVVIVQFSSPFPRLDLFYFESKKHFTVQPWTLYICVLRFPQESFHLTLFIILWRFSLTHWFKKKRKKEGLFSPSFFFRIPTAAHKTCFWKHASVWYRKILGPGYNLHAHLVIITF